MDKLSRIRTVFHGNTLFLAGLCLCAYFSYHAYYGERSYAHLLVLEELSQEKAATLDDLRGVSGALEIKVGMLRSNSLSRDMLEERVGFVLGYHRDNDRVVVGN